MTESQWLAFTDPDKMLSSLHGKISARKRRLFAAACLRRIAHLFPDGRCLQSVAVAERYADRLTSRAELIAAKAEAEAAYAATGVHDSENPPPDTCGTSAGLFAADAACRVTHLTTRHYAKATAELAVYAIAWASLPPRKRTSSAIDVKSWLAGEAGETAAQARILHDLVGNPFRPVAIRPAWKTAVVVALARSIYEEGRFDELPILADALTEAGCPDEVILGHCRGTGPHVRGCWVLDKILAKK